MSKVIRSDKNEKEEESTISKTNKKEYQSPTILSEDLNTYGALCNGTTTGGRKVTATPVPAPLCNSARLNS